MKQSFTFDTYSKTIRLMPENYLVATTEKGHLVVDADDAISDELATRIFVLLRQHELKFCRQMDNILASLDLLLDENVTFYSKMGQYLSDDEQHYDKIIAALRKALVNDPNQMLDYVEIDKGDENEVSLETISVWEKVEFEFTVKEFCELIGIK